MKDMRSFIELVRARDPEGVVEIGREIDPRYQVTALQKKLEDSGRRPLLIFRRIKGSNLPLVLNLFGHRARLALALDTGPEQVVEEYYRREGQRLKLELVSQAPVQEVVREGPEVDLTTLPLLTAHEPDAAPYITSALMVARDPDNGVPNVSFGRLMLVDRSTLYTHLTPGRHLHDYYVRAEARGQPLDISINIGLHPAWALGALSLVGIEEDELEVMGALAGEPVRVVSCRTVEAWALADAEIVLEGQILPHERRPEGPFCEFTRYAIGQRKRHVVRVTALTSRAEPLYLGLTCGSSEHHMFGAVAKEAYLWKAAKRCVPSVTALHLPESGCSRFICYVSLKKRHKGQPRDVGLAILSADIYAKMVVVVDEDIDVTNESEVLWAVATRSQPGRDFVTIPDCVGADLDPSASEEGVVSKLIIDATAKPSLASYPPRAGIPQAVLESLDVERFLCELGG